MDIKRWRLHEEIKSSYENSEQGHTEQEYAEQEHDKMECIQEEQLDTQSDIKNIEENKVEELTVKVDNINLSKDDSQRNSIKRESRKVKSLNKLGKSLNASSAPLTPSLEHEKQEEINYEWGYGYYW